MLTGQVIEHVVAVVGAGLLAVGGWSWYAAARANAKKRLEERFGKDKK